MGCKHGIEGACTRCDAEREIAERDAEIARLRKQESLARYDLMSIIAKCDGVILLSDIAGLASQTSNIVAGLRAERDAAIAKIAAHNAAMDAECHECLTRVAGFPCGTDDNPCSICPRRHRIEVDG